MDDFPRGPPWDALAERAHKILEQHLQTAITLELYTIPMYLFAAYSIKDENSEARDKIIDVSREEMLHLGLAGNILNAIGGYPRLYGNEYTPEFPRTLFYTNLRLNLKPAVQDTINLFMKVEAPQEHWDYQRIGGLLPGYESIGEFYKGLAQGLSIVDPMMPPVRRVLFWKTTTQLDSDMYPGGEMIVVKNLEDAIKALKTIVDQGEGNDGDGGHYKIFQQMSESNLDCYDVLENIDSANHKTEKFYSAMVACDAVYCYLLMTIEKLWQYDGQKRKALIEQNIRNAMRPVIPSLAQFLVKQKITSGAHVGKHAGPPFRLWKAAQSGKELEELKRLMSDVVNGYPDEQTLKRAKDKVDKFVDLSDL